MAKKIVLSEPLKKYLKVAGYILLNGIVTFVSRKYLSVGTDLALVFGGLANFIVLVLEVEIKKEGVIEALK